MTLELALLVLLLLLALLSLALVLIVLSSATVFLLPTKSITVRLLLTWLGLNTRQLTHRLFRQRPFRTGLSRWYTWEFPARPTIRQPSHPARFFIELPVDQARYIEYNQRSRELNASRFDMYVTVTLPEIEALADKLLILGQTHGYGTYDQLCNALAFVQQNIRYTADLCPQTGKLIEYPKYPIETLVEKRGDCEDQAILAAALLKRMGYEVALLVLPTHVALGVAGFKGIPGSYVIHLPTGVRYLYAETSAENWLPGEVPREFQSYLASGQFEILPVKVQETQNIPAVKIEKIS